VGVSKRSATMYIASKATRRIVDPSLTLEAFSTGAGAVTDLDLDALASAFFLAATAGAADLDSFLAIVLEMICSGFCMR
jgi:hypothetical protein